MKHIYIYKIEVSNETIVITFCKFGKTKQITTSCDFLQIIEYGMGAKTTSSFRIISYDGITYKKIIQQYKIGAWKKEENIAALKKMIENNGNG